MPQYQYKTEPRAIAARVMVINENAWHMAVNKYYIILYNLGVQFWAGDKS